MTSSSLVRCLQLGWSFDVRRLIGGAVVFACLCSHAALVINEVCYDNNALSDETGDTGSDWIELFNSGPGSVNVHNYAVSDANPFEVGKGVLLPDYTIPPGGFLVVFADSERASYTAWTNAADLALIPANSTWKYLTPAGAPPGTWRTSGFNDANWASSIAPFGYNDATHGLDAATTLSFGDDSANRYPTAYFRKTFSVINPAVITGLVVQARINDGMVLYLNGHEVLRQNLPLGTIAHDTLASQAVPPSQWTTNSLPPTWIERGINVLAVEVHQASVSSADLIMDLTVTAQVNELVPIVHGSFGLSKEGENVHLFDSALRRIHRFAAPGFEIGEDRSYGYSPDGVLGSEKVRERPTPGFSNASFPQKYAQVLTGQKPVLSIQPGFYAASQKVVLSTPTAGYRIFYTLDGSAPQDSGRFVYSGDGVVVAPADPVTSGLSWIRTSPVELTQRVPTAGWQAPVGSVAKAVVLRAIAVSADGLYCSPEVSGTYFIGPQFTNRVLPVVSLIVDTNHLFGFTNGIYVPGKRYADSAEGYGVNNWGKPNANYHQVSKRAEWERSVQFELFETNQATAAVSQMLGLAMYGGGTRALPQKSLYFLARLGEYGAEFLDYPLIPEESSSRYKRFLLRNSGNDWYGPDPGGVGTMLKDAVFHRMIKGLDISSMAYRPTVAYINGEYWGIHNLRESLDKHYLAKRYGLEPENCDILMHEEDPLDNNKVKIERVEGDVGADEEYEAMIDWIQTHPLAHEANYAEVQRWVDVTNYADYIIAETFFGNTDWPINNCDFWRAHTNQVASCGKYGDGRWRWLLYDLDAAGSGGPGFNMFDFLSSSRMTGGSEPGFLINQLWRNAEFLTYFVERYAVLLNTTFRPERLADIVTQAAEAIATEIETHFRRWGRSHTQAQWRAAVTNALIQYTATRHEVSWEHLDQHFGLGGTGLLTLQNQDPSGTGGSFRVGGVRSEPLPVDGKSAVWSGRFFRGVVTRVQAVPEPGYVFDRWVGTAITNPAPALFVGAAPITLVARFRPASAPAHTPTGYERWQVANYNEREILSGVVAAPGAASGYAGMSNFELYAFGMHRHDGLSDEQRLARTSLCISNLGNGLRLGYTRLNDSFNDVRYTLKVARSLDVPSPWTDAVIGADLGWVSFTNVIDASSWYYQINLPSAGQASGARFFRLETTLE